MPHFYHHSRLLPYRTPQGAAAAGETVRLAADADAGIAEVLLRLWIEGESEQLIRMKREGGRAAAEIVLPERPCLVWYFFVLRLADGHTLYYGAPSGEGMFVKHEPPAYQITVYDPAFATPRAFCEGVCCQIFPDRFKRSSWEDFRTRAAEHTGRGRRILLHDRWSDAPKYAPGPGEADYEPNDFFGGDLNGIRQKLPYLQELGVTWLYLNPVFESASNHRYDTGDYRRIDPILGTEEEFAALCREARALGIRILLDGVFSHTGADSRYFNRFGRYDSVGAAQSSASPYYGWYTFAHFPDRYECWWGFPSLPNVRELAPSYSEFIAGEDGVIACWMRRGVSGWRLDVADELPDAFIRLVRARIKRLDPEAVLIGEVWEDCSNKFAGSVRRDYVDGDVLDSAMNYPFAEAVIHFLTGRGDAFALNEALATLREHYPKPFFDAMLNLLGSHDSVRLQTALSGAPDRRKLTRAEQAEYRPSERDAALGRRRVPLAASIQAVFPGVPCLYYGDEAGMTGMADPFNRGPYPWGSEDAALVETYRRLLTCRRDADALKRGCCRMGALQKDVFAIVRYLPGGGQTAVLFVNRGESAQAVLLGPDTLAEGPDAAEPVALSGAFRDVLSGERFDFPDGTMRVSVGPMQSILLIRG